MPFNLKGLLQDEEFLFAAGLLQQGSQGKSIGEGAFSSLIQAGKIKKTFADTAKTTKSVFSIKDNKNVLASDIEISKDKANYLPATKAKDLSVNDLGINVYRKLDGLTGEAFDSKLKSLPQNEQDVYAKIIKGNEDWFSSLIKDNIKNNKSEMPDLSGYQITEKSKGKSIEEWITASKGMNKDMSVEEIIENLISNGIITAR